jgi:hypothetical protein
MAKRKPTKVSTRSNVRTYRQAVDFLAKRNGYVVFHGHAVDAELDYEPDYVVVTWPLRYGSRRGQGKTLIAAVNNAIKSQ